MTADHDGLCVDADGRHLDREELLRVVADIDAQHGRITKRRKGFRWRPEWTGPPTAPLSITWEDES